MATPHTTCSTEEAPEAAEPARPPVPGLPAETANTSLLSIGTLVVWLACLAIGSLGLVLHYARPRPLVKTPPPVQAEILNVQLTTEPVLPPDVAPPPPNPSQPPPLQTPVVIPPTPALTPVAAPNPAIAFALPVEGPTRIVDAKQASYARNNAPTNAAPVVAPQVQALTFGSGEGKQPAPEYPQQAVREGQEGVVTIRFSIGENGRIIEAEAVKPSPWPLLNDAAVRVVRNRWRFRPGVVRLCEVSIRFQLAK